MYLLNAFGRMDVLMNAFGRMNAILIAIIDAMADTSLRER
jgi:hypothetical protein